jgi:hypothetical protein
MHDHAANSKSTIPQEFYLSEGVDASQIDEYWSAQTSETSEAQVVRSTCRYNGIRPAGKNRKRVINRVRLEQFRILQWAIPVANGFSVEFGPSHL